MGVTCQSLLNLTNFTRHDPDEEDAVVMKAPSKEHQKKFNIKHVTFYYSKHATANNGYVEIDQSWQL